MWQGHEQYKLAGPRQGPRWRVVLSHAASTGGVQGGGGRDSSHSGSASHLQRCPHLHLKELTCAFDDKTLGEFIDLSVV